MEIRVPQRDDVRKTLSASNVWSVPNVKLTYLKGHSRDNYMRFEDLIDKVSG